MSIRNKKLLAKRDKEETMVLDLAFNWIKTKIFNTYAEKHITDERIKEEERHLNYHFFSLDTTVILAIIIICLLYYAAIKYRSRSKLTRTTSSTNKYRNNIDIELKRLAELEGGVND